MSGVLLIRHGLCDTVGRVLAGRGPGIHLNTTGQQQARALGEALAALPLAAVYSGPLERVRETAEAIAGPCDVEVRTAPGLDELDYGAWTGSTLAALVGDPAWERFNRERGTTRIPGGESMAEVASRASAAVRGMLLEHPDGLVAAVTHGDVIRVLLVHWAGRPLEDMLRLEIAPASVSAVRFAPGPELIVMNWRPSLGEALGQAAGTGAGRAAVEGRGLATTLRARHEGRSGSTGK